MQIEFLSDDFKLGWQPLIEELELTKLKGSKLTIGTPYNEGWDLGYWLRRAVHYAEAQAFLYDHNLDLKNPVSLSYEGNGEGRAELPLTQYGHKKALFLDRDGIINVDKAYVYKSEDVEFVDGIVELLQWARHEFDLIIVLTNQSGVGRGYYQIEDVETLHEWMDEQLQQSEAIVDRWYYSPYHPKADLEKLRKESYSRKPGSGMALHAASDYSIDLEHSVMIGDKVSDYLKDLQMMTVFKIGNYPLESELPKFQTHLEILEYLKENMK